MPSDRSRLSLNLKEIEEQRKDVIEHLVAQKNIPSELVEEEVCWFYEYLGIDQVYFVRETVEAIANHITLLYSTKMEASLKDTKEVDINLRQETEDGAMYIHSSGDGTGPSKKYIHKADSRIDEQYLDREDSRLYRVESFLSKGMLSHNLRTFLRCLFVNKGEVFKPNPTKEEGRSLDNVADFNLLQRLSQESKKIYEAMMNEAQDNLGVVVKVETRVGYYKLMIAYRRGSTTRFMSSITDLYHHYGFHSVKKYVENFSDGINMMAIYLKASLGRVDATDDSISYIVKEVSILYAMPSSQFTELFQNGHLNAQEMMYAMAGFLFNQHFLNRLGKEYWDLKDILSPSKATHQQLLTILKKRLRGETFNSDSIASVVKQYPEVIRRLFIHFALKNHLDSSRESNFSASIKRLTQNVECDQESLEALIQETAVREHDKEILRSFLLFNNSIVRTNFYNPKKVAFSFRLKGDFLPEVEYPQKPFAVFLVIGPEFRGFHVRFQDIARGGIRIVRSRNSEFFELNRRYLFDENYALASTQNRKNKDIPEGGSKGTILLNADKQHCAKLAFEKYIDSMIDLLVDERGPKSRMKSAPEILFFGPDEGTADYMDWASLHAKKRGLKYWKAITTGKSQSMGGIPHDLYGMTTMSVHRYVEGIYRKMDLDESEVTKFQTGGPDGDLGSNEIKVSKDLTIGVVDGSGVLYDPEGINREELLRLATERKMIVEFDKAKLSPEGFQVLVDQTNVKLPDGTEVVSGLEFRNTFHLNELSTADIFVPCGGRPEAVDISNYQKLLWEDMTPRFNFIVEGANLFITQDARIRLEKAGCIIFKDASANKGGVTSSSLEVLAALAMNDEEFAEHMTVKDGVIPPFYQAYVEEVQKIIALNADLEFECLWKESQANPERTRAELSDDLSYAILELNIQLQEDRDLWENEHLRSIVLKQAFPKLLQEKLGGLDKMVTRLPENYLKAVYGAFLASRFIYSQGISPSQLAFFEYVATSLQTEAAKQTRPAKVEDAQKELKAAKISAVEPEKEPAKLGRSVNCEVSE